MQNFLYQILEHSGDLRILAQGENYVEALAHASLGLLSQIVPRETVEEVSELPIKVTGETDQERALAFLNELLYLAYARRWIPKRVKHLTQCSRKNCLELEGTLVGEPVDPRRHEFRYDVKAVTYHDFKLEQIPGRTTIEFVCDL